MSNANDFIIENGVLKKYVGPGGAVIVPEEVTEIGIKAFVSGGYQVSSTITSIQCYSNSLGCLLWLLKS